MKKERVILSFIAVVIGLAVAGILFYVYQMTKTVSPTTPRQNGLTVATPTPDSNHFLTITTPREEDIVSNKTITISGKTTPDATVIVSSNTDEQVVTPAQNGNFTLTQLLENGANQIQITAIFPTGEEKTVTRTVSYTTESF